MLLTRAANEVSTAFPGQPTFTPMSLFIATWLQVPPFGDPEVNTFQVVMASDGQRSFVLFLYDDIQGTNGGRALAGINGGDGVRSVTVPGSLSEAIMNITTTSNVGRPGVWMYRVDTDEPVFRLTHEQGVVTICDEVIIELVSGTLAFPTEITIEIDNVLNTLTFPSGSVPNTTLSFRPTLISNNRRLVALATVTPVGYINSAIVALFTNDSEPVLYCTSFVRGSSSTDGFVQVNLQNGPFRFLEQNYTSIFVNSNGDVSLSAAFTSFSPRVLPLASFNPPILAPFWSDSDAGDGGLVLYAETQDSMLLTQAANEVMTAFPNQPTFTPMSLFIATWLQVPPFNGPGVNTFQVVMASDGQRSFVIFVYDDIQWINGGSALAGINGGDGVRSVTVPGSLSLSIMNIMTTSNVGRPGVWMYRVDTPDIINPSEP
ncbi:mucin-4-like [Halichondria panicea]|uniref:mucin-4-like n=1 Tax=Halichondria panicea TaxID=6063 RepID=UPI00312B7A72